MSKDDDELEFDIEELDDEEEEPDKAGGEGDSEEEEPESPEEDDEPEEDPAPEPGESRKEYGKRAQKRIHNLISNQKNLERELAKQREEAARLKLELKKSRQEAEKLDEYAAENVERSIESQETALNSAWKQAHEADDADALAEINKKIARLQVDKEKLDRWKAGRKRAEERKKEEQEDDDPPPQQQQQQRPQVSPQTQAWMNRNRWFGKDEEKTYAAIDIHRSLVDEGVVPDSKEYFAEIDKRMVEEFPDMKKPQASQQRVGGKSRTQKRGGKKTITLTREERETAQRLGVPLKEYAKQKALLEKSA